MESEPLRLKKLILNSFGDYTGMEISLDDSFKIFAARKETAGQTVVDAIVGVLFGWPPDRREEVLQYAPPAAGGFRASLALTTDEQDEYLIGKDFHRGQVEIFKQEGFRLTHLAPATVMEILHAEVRTLNPIDFEALFVFRRGAVEIRQDSPVIREQLQKMAYKRTKEDAGFSTFYAPAEDDAARAPEHKPPEPAEGTGLAIQDRLAEMENKIKAVKAMKEELLRISGQKKKFALYEPFLTDDRQSRLEKLSQQLTDIALERKYLEEKIRENRENEETIRREILTLRQKLASFPPEFLSPEFQEHITELARKKEEKLRLMQQLEEKLRSVAGRKGLLSRRSRREEMTELEERIARRMEETAAIRDELSTLLKGRTVEEYLSEVELHRKYREDLPRLEKHPVQQITAYEETRQKLRRQEEEIRKKMHDLLSLAGSAEYKVLKEKVGLLNELTIREKEIQKELEALGGDSPEAALAALEQEEQRLKELKVKARPAESRKPPAEEKSKPRPQPAAGEPLFSLWRRADKLTEQLTEGNYTGICPEVQGGELLLLARKKTGSSWAPEQDLPQRMRDLVRLAFRLFVARLHTPARSFPLLFEAPAFLGARQGMEKLLAPVREFVPEAQILVFLPHTR